jgi:hypothetical protein
LSDEHLGVVVALGRHVCAEVPLADDGRLVAGLLQQLGEGLLGSVELISVAEEAVQVAVLARLDDRPAGPADRVGDVAVVETHALFGEPVEVGRLVELQPIGRHFLVGADVPGRRGRR